MEVKLKKVYIVEAVRLPIGAFGGSLKGFMAQELGAMVIRECLDRSGVDAAFIDEIVVGNIMQYDPKGNPGREAALLAEVPQHVPAYTINKNCGSSIKAIGTCATSIKAGEADVMMAVGMENMTASPYLLKKARFGFRMGDGVIYDSLTAGLEGMGMTAERLAEKYSISREEQDAFAMKSQQKASRAIADQVFADEILPVKIVSRKKEYLLDADEGVKASTTLESLGQLRPAFLKGGTVTAGNSSTINDSAAALLVVSEEKMNELGLKPLAEVVAYASAGCDPDIMGIGPVPATKKVMKLSGLKVEDMDLIELNEAFAAQSLAVIKELGLESMMDRININGSGISLGHPVGATGAIIVTKLVHQLKRHNKEYGLATMCIGGGQGISMILRNPNVQGA